MIYVTDTRKLYTDSGELIKHISCPLATRLARVVSAAEPDREFNCMYCATKVKNLAYLSDEQALAAAKVNPYVCFFATHSAPNVVHITQSLPFHSEVKSWMSYKARSEPKRLVIRTARTLEEMNFAAANGFKLLFRRVGSVEGVRLQLAVYQNSETGKVEFTDDARYPLDSEYATDQNYKAVFDYFMYQPAGPDSPVAAYVIPPNLESGSEVFVEDAIEDLLCQMPQQTTERLSGWWALWNGEDLKFLPHHRKSAILG